jgi:hypothetical protein
MKMWRSLSFRDAWSRWYDVVVYFLEEVCGPRGVAFCFINNLCLTVFTSSISNIMIKGIKYVGTTFCSCYSTKKPNT